MQGKYIKPDGEEVEVEEYDEINKMVCVKFVHGKQQWYHEAEYSLWKSTEIDTEPVVIEKEKKKPVKKKAAVAAKPKPKKK